MSRKIDIAALPPVLGTCYPPPHDQPCLSRGRMGQGDAAGFKADAGAGHCLRNHSPHDAVVLEVGTRVNGDDVTCSEVGMLAPASGQPALYSHGDGTPCDDLQRRGRKIP